MQAHTWPEVSCENEWNDICHLDTIHSFTQCSIWHWSSTLPFYRFKIPSETKSSILQGCFVILKRWGKHLQFNIITYSNIRHAFIKRSTYWNIKFQEIKYETLLCILLCDLGFNGLVCEWSGLLVWDFFSDLRWCFLNICNDFFVVSFTLYIKVFIWVEYCLTAL